MPFPSENVQHPQKYNYTKTLVDNNYFQNINFCTDRDIIVYIVFPIKEILFLLQ